MFTFKGFAEVGTCDYTTSARKDAVIRVGSSTNDGGKVFPSRKYNKKLSGAPYCYEDATSGGLNRWFKTHMKTFLDKGGP
jgi:hypothetical protein